jgi:hypothetical protein
VDFTVIGQIEAIETFAVGHGIRELRRLRRKYGAGRWRKRKGLATVRLSDGFVARPSYTGTRPLASAGES